MNEINCNPLHTLEQAILAHTSLPNEAKANQITTDQLRARRSIQVQPACNICTQLSDINITLPMHALFLVSLALSVLAATTSATSVRGQTASLRHVLTAEQRVYAFYYVWCVDAGLLDAA